MSKFSYPLAALALSCTPAAFSAEPKVMLNAAEIVALVVGNTIRYVNKPDQAVNEYFAPDGVVRGMSKKGGRYASAWEIRRGNMLCIINEDPKQSGCVQVHVRGSVIEFHRLDGVLEGPFELRGGNPEKL